MDSIFRRLRNPAKLALGALFAAWTLFADPTLYGDEPKDRSDAAAEQADATASESREGAESGGADAAPESTPTRPIEEEIERGADDRLRFRFQGQPWLGVLEWLARALQVSLDWQEVPDGELNLVTQDAYTLDETRDLINMHLLARGFTLLRRGEVLTLVKLENVNLALVPTVTPEELAGRDEYEWVRTTFPLSWLPAEKAAEQFEPLLSTSGQVHPLSAANQIEVVDAVINLRTLQDRVATLDNPSETRLVREFKLKYARAEDVMDSVNELLGQESNPWRRFSGESMRLQAEQERQRVELLKSMGSDAKRYLRDDPVHMVANVKENSILVSAAPDKIEIVKQAIEAIDRPSQSRQSLAADPDRLKIYPISRIETDSVRDMLEELKDRGALNEDVEIEADYRNDRLIIYADNDDHQAIARFIEQVSPQNRQSVVIPLRVLEPAYAISAVNLMLEHLVQEQSSGYRGADQERFRIEADAANRRLLMWATEDEEQQVRRLLEQLGEQAGAEAETQQVRVVAPGAADAEKILARLEAIWPQISDHPLRIDGKEPSAPPMSRSTDARSDESSEEENRRASNEAASHDARLAVFAHRVREAAAESSDLEAESDTSDEESLEDATPPVFITTGPDGRLLVVSSDPAAAGRAADLIEALGPSKDAENVFQLKSASAYAVQYQLEEIFEATGEYESSYGYYGRRRSSDSTSTLAPQQTLSFHSDATTNTLLVQNATPEQLQRIKQLIEIYDRPEFADEEIERQTVIYSVRHGEADAIAEVLKDVYRDLLSASDRAFDQIDSDRRGSAGYVGLAYSRRKTPQYKGLLSVGVDETNNRLAISAPGYLMEEVLDTVKKLDGADSARTVAVLRSPAGIAVQNLGGALGVEVSGGDSRRGSYSGRDRDRDRERYRRGGRD